MKKIFILFALILSIFSVSAITITNTTVLTQCPTTNIENNTHYILASTFLDDQTTCFQLDAGVHDVIIDGNNTDFEFSRHFAVQITNISEVHIANMSLSGYGMYVRHYGASDTVYLYNNKIYQIEYTNAPFGLSQKGIIYPTDGSSIDDLQIYDNYFEFVGNAYEDEHTGIFIGVLQNYNYYYNATIFNNDIVNGRLDANLDTGTIYDRFRFDKLRVFDNNLVFSVATDFYSRGVFFETSCPSANYEFSGNLAAWYSVVDADQDGTSDSTQTFTHVGCTLLNTYVPTRKDSYIFDNTKYITYPVFTNIGNGYTWKVAKPLTLTSSAYLGFDSYPRNTIDLGLFAPSIALNPQNVRTIRLGTDNVLTGLGKQGSLAIVDVTGTISVPYTTYYGNNWNIIEYTNNVQIDNVNFDLDATDNYGLVRKASSAVDGINFYFINNTVDLNYVPADPDRPQFLVGALSYFKNNTFDLLGTVNVSLIGGGTSSNIGGGHVIIDNTFNGGGYIFSALSDLLGGGTNYPSKFIHNKFAQVGTLYARPFHPTDNSQNLLDDPALNGTYYYRTTCTNYEYNLGNWYEDWDDSGFYNDTNGDGIHDEYLGVTYIERGQDFEGDPIRDYRSVTPYPFDLAGQTGNAEATYDTCAAFNWNIIAPTEQNYTSGYDLTSNWEYTEILYPNMYCFETINGYTVLYEDVDSGENQGVTWEMSDGEAYHTVRCCDNIGCSNIVKDSPETYFCIGDCDLGVASVTNTSSPTTPDGGDEEEETGGGDITDITSGTGFGIFSTTASDTTDNIASLLSLSETPMVYFMILGFVLLIFASIALLFAIIKGGLNAMK